MALANCAVCKQVFNKTNRDSCPKCWEREQGLFERVSDYLHVNSEASALEVVKRVGVTKDDLLFLLKRGRLLGYGNFAASLLKCQRCGLPSERGMYCAACVTAIKAGASPEEDSEASGTGKGVGAGAKLADGPNKNPGSRPIGPGLGESRSDYWRNKSQR